MVDDRSNVVSLPEVPLLGVLPGTGGLTRVTSISARCAAISQTCFARRCGRRARECVRRSGASIDHIAAKPARIRRTFVERSLEGTALVRAGSVRAADERGVSSCIPLERSFDASGYRITSMSTSSSIVPRAFGHPNGARAPNALAAAGRRANIVALGAMRGGRCSFRASARRRDPHVAYERARHSGILATAKRKVLPRPCSPSGRDACSRCANIGSCARRPACLRRTLARLDVSSRSACTRSSIAVRASPGLLFETRPRRRSHATCWRCRMKRMRRASALDLLASELRNVSRW